MSKLVLLRAQLTKIYPPLPTSVQSISIIKTLLIVPTKNERNPPLFTGKLLIKFYTPRNEVVGGYTGFTMSVRPSVDKSYVVR
jgi:hypothetical protein